MAFELPSNPELRQEWLRLKPAMRKKAIKAAMGLRWQKLETIRESLEQTELSPALVDWVITNAQQRVLDWEAAVIVRNQRRSMPRTRLDHLNRALIAGIFQMVGLMWLSQEILLMRKGGISFSLPLVLLLLSVSTIVFAINTVRFFRGPRDK